MLRILFIILTVAHALIHLFGFIKAFELAELSQLTKQISKPIGVFWLLSFLLFLSVILLFSMKWDGWWKVAIIAIVLSEFVIINSWTNAKWGTVINLIILIPTIAAIFESLPSSLSRIYESNVEVRLKAQTEHTVLTPEHLAHLPAPVQKYLVYTQSVGKPIIKNFQLNFDGQFKQKVASNWLKIKSSQHNFYDSPARYFLMKSNLYGIPFQGLHIYEKDEASMVIKLASILKVVDSKSDFMHQSETVTFFNDICIYAPTSLVDKSIKWKLVDSLTVEAIYANAGSVISAKLYFNEIGELVNFESADRYLSEDGIKHELHKWSTPISDYKEYRGRKIPFSGNAIWHLPDGEFYYAKFKLEEIKYNNEKTTPNISSCCATLSFSRK